MSKKEHHLSAMPVIETFNVFIVILSLHFILSPAYCYDTHMFYALRKISTLYFIPINSIPKACLLLTMFLFVGVSCTV